jgi:vesicle coat complex subunit
MQTLASGGRLPGLWVGSGRRPSPSKHLRTSEFSSSSAKNQLVRSWTASALRQIGPAAEPAVPALVKALGDPDPEVQISAAEALGRIGPAAEPAVPALIEALGDPDADVQRTASETLGRIGLAAKAAVPALINALGSADPGVRRDAARAMAEIAAALYDASATEALSLLREARDLLQTHPDPDVIEYAAPIRRTIEYLELHQWEEIRKEVLGWVNAHPYFTFIVGAVRFGV